jgi:hypothetical protein
MCRAGPMPTDLQVLRPNIRASATETHSFLPPRPHWLSGADNILSPSRLVELDPWRNLTTDFGPEQKIGISTAVEPVYYGEPL